MTSSITAAALAVSIAVSGSPVELPTDVPADTAVVEETFVEDAVEVVADETAPAVTEEPPVSDVPAPLPVAEVVEEETVAPAAVLAVDALVPTNGLIPLGPGTIQASPGAPVIEVERFMPQPRNAHITGLAKPETSTGTRPDEPVIDLWSLVGSRGGPTGTELHFSGFEYTQDGALARTPQYTAPGVSTLPERFDASEYTWRIDRIGALGVIDTADLNGKLTLVPFAENAEYGVNATLVHKATGAEAQPIRITGFSGSNSDGGFDWVNGTQRTFDGGVGMWEAYDRSGWRDNRFLSWSNPSEHISATGALEVRSTAPSMAPGLRGDGGEVGTPAGFGLTNYGGVIQAGVAGSGVSHRIGQLHGEPVERVVFDLADYVEGATSVALPDGPTGVLTLDPSTAWQNGTRFVGLDYQAPGGLTFEVSGTTVTATFGSAEWVNRLGLVIPVRTADGVEWAEIRSESLPRDIAGGLVEKRIPTDTELFVSDSELLEASRLTGLSPSLAEVQAAELPEGVTRVANGFSYAGSEEPTELAFGFTVAETVETEFGPVRPDVAGPGEVRIAVFADDVTPEPEPETPEVPTPEAPETPTPETPAKADPPKGGPSTTDNDAATGDGPFEVAAAEEKDARVQTLTVTGIAALVLASLAFAAGVLFGRRRKVIPVTADEA